jgi:tetratricopeptide (TPR) repeat protein
MSMGARAQAMERLVMETAGFLRDEACAVLQVLVDPELRRSALELVVAQEFRPTQAAPFVAFDEAHAATRRGWQGRAASARAQHERRRVGLEAEIAALPPAPEARDERIGFGLQLQQLVQASPPNAEGLVVVLAPTQIELGAELVASLDLLRRELRGVRWIVIEADGDALGPWVATLGPAARRVDLRVPAADGDAELAALVADRPPAAPRGVVPPARSDVRVRVPDVDGVRRREIGKLSLAASLAQSRGRPAEAIEAQRRARDLAAEAGWVSEAITLEIALGSRLVAAGALADAEASFLRAIEAANAGAMHDKATTAGFGLGATRAVRGAKPEALVAYADAAIAADKTGSAPLVIEANRAAGRTAQSIGLSSEAAAFFAKAQAAEDAAAMERG